MNFILNIVFKSLVKLGLYYSIISLEDSLISLEFGNVLSDRSDLFIFSDPKISDKFLVLISKDLYNTFFKSVLGIKESIGKVLRVSVHEF